MKRLVIAIGLAVLVTALPVAAQEQKLLPTMPEPWVPDPGMFRCSAVQLLCVTHARDFFELRGKVVNGAEKDAEISRLSAELEKLRSSCVAKLEVVPPKKTIPIDPKTNRGT